MGHARPARRVFWLAMRANVPSLAGLVKDLGRAVPAQEKKIGGPARPISPWIILAVPCRASGPCQWAVGYDSGLLYFQKILISK